MEILYGLKLNPEKWLFDEKAKMLVMEKLILSGVRFDKERNLSYTRF